uniref:AKT-interacting protein-like n=1 Tax=Diabrotica virgifera virgifera TaxID=50390 RepID=A0A6P7GYH0_DIAVI
MSLQLKSGPGLLQHPSPIWFGVIFVRSGCYEEGIFRFTIFLDEEFPDSGHPYTFENTKKQSSMVYYILTNRAMYRNKQR